MPAKVSYSNRGRQDNKDRKRKEGEERNSYWQSLSPQQQLDSLKQRRGNSARQVAKISQKLGA